MELKRVELGGVAAALHLKVEQLVSVGVQEPKNSCVALGLAVCLLSKDPSSTLYKRRQGVYSLTLSTTESFFLSYQTEHGSQSRLP